MINKISPSTNTRLWQIDVLIGKLLTKCLSKPVKLNLDRLNILKKTSNNKISPFIEHRSENGWGLYGLLNIQKGEKAKIAQQQSHSSNHVMTNFLIHLLDYS